jgi:hypothetical protein
MSLAWLGACDAPARQTAPEPSLAPNFSRASGSAGEGSDESDKPDEEGHRHEFGLIGLAAARAAQFTRTSGTGISYHGGTVLQGGINVVAVYWGNAAVYSRGPAAGSFNVSGNSGDGSVVGQFLRDIDGSAYYNINSTYKNAVGTPLVNAVKYTGYWANNSSVPANGQNVTDANMITMLQTGFTTGKLKYDPNTLYTIFTAGTVNLGGGAGTQYCAYHTNASVTVPGMTGPQRIYYAAMPYNAGWPSGCTSGLASPNGDPAADAEVNTLIHEIEETQTDALGNAWYDSRGYENADKCAWQWGTTYTVNGGKANITPKAGGRSYLVQMNWINSGSGGCRISWP